MKRLRVILLFLLLGAIVNVAVAWSIALTVTSENFRSDDMVMGELWTADEHWTLDRHETFGSQYFESRRWKVHFAEEESLRLTELSGGDEIENVKPSWGLMDVVTNMYQTLPGPPKYSHEFRGYEARGWPMLSLWSLPRIMVIGDTGNIKEFEPKGFIATPILPDDARFSRGLSLYPIWTGFFANTLFYAVLLWLLFPGPFVFRRMSRRKRGLCVKCAYDLRGAEHEACPECGEEVPTHREL